MKSLKLLFSLFAGLLLLSSCDKDEMGPVMSTNPKAPAIFSPKNGQTYSLTEDEAQDTLLTFEWSKPDYGFSSAPEYRIQMSKSGEEFTEPVELATVNKTSYSIVTSDMNNKLLSFGFIADQTANVDFRVVASISDSIPNQISDPVALEFLPYEVIVSYPSIWVPGGYQAESGYVTDWSPEEAPALESVNSDDYYEGYVYMASDGSEFKFTAERNWSGDEWGDNEGDGTLDPRGDNIKAPEAGYYKIDVDLNSLTYTMLKTSWGLIGSATADGWDADQDMTYDSEAKIWTITTDLTAGEIKFRANNAWDLEYGDTDGDFILEAGGDDIPVDEPGNYTITMDLSKVPYSYAMTKN